MTRGRNREGLCFWSGEAARDGNHPVQPLQPKAKSDPPCDSLSWPILHGVQLIKEAPHGDAVVMRLIPRLIPQPGKSLC